MLVGLLWLVSGASLVARAADDLPASSPTPSIEGDWLVETRDAVIRIQRQGDEYEGHIVWQLHDTYGPEDGPDLNGKTVTDRKNPDPSLRSQPLTGLRLLWGLHYDAASASWVDGHVYDSDNGKSYQCEIHLIDANRLKLRGYIGITLLGGNTVWSRVPVGSTPGGQAQPAASGSALDAPMTLSPASSNSLTLRPGWVVFLTTVPADQGNSYPSQLDGHRAREV